MRVDPPSPLQSYYAARAGEYDAVYEKPERQADLRQIERWLAATLAAQRVLEIACGTGYWTRFLAPVVSSIVAIDSAPETLRIAERRIAAPNVVFRLGDAYSLRPDTPPFSAAFAGFWFSHVPLARQREFLDGLNAALGPGARVVMLDNLFVEGSSSTISERDADGNTYQSRRLGDGSTHRVLKNFPTEEQLRALAAPASPQTVAYREWDFYWAFEYAVPEAPPPRPGRRGEAE